MTREASLDRARELILAYGWNSTSYQLLNPGFELWFDPSHRALVGYVPRSGFRVVGGAPVCADDALAQTIENFENDAARSGDRVCYFGAGSRLRSALSTSSRHSSIALGAEPVWSPARWRELVHSRASLRAQFNRARNKGVVVGEWRHDDPRVRSLRRLIAEWLGTKGLPPMHFLVEPETLARLFDRRLFVATIGNEAVGFLVASPVPARNGWLVEQIIRGAAAPNGAAELLLDTAVQAFEHDRADYVTLGLVPLSSHGGADEIVNPAWIHLLFSWTRAHGNRFYNFVGLEAFKSKFSPQRWDPVVAIANESPFSFAALYAIADAFSDESVTMTLARALLRAAGQEVRWLMGTPVSTGG